ncbi:MAG: hypothetical protein NTX22_11605 [Ignavibacteriales bacterium]|nr:hypothetical protein [Ignavibacteriales bacterium]
MKMKVLLVQLLVFIGIASPQNNPSKSGNIFSTEWIYPKLPDTLSGSFSNEKNQTKSCTILPPDSLRTFGNIRGMGCDKNNYLYIWDDGYQALWKFTSNGEKVWRKKFLKGNNENEFMNVGPAFAVSKDGKICLGDKSNRTLSILDNNGNFEGRFPVKMMPASITFGGNGSIYLVGFPMSYKGNLIHHYSVTGEFLGSFCERKDTAKAILFSGNCGRLETDDEGNILYSHLYRYKIDGFSKDGNLLNTFGKNIDELLIPGIRGITLLNKDYLFVFVFGEEEKKWNIDFYNKSEQTHSFPSETITSPKFQYRYSAADSNNNIYFDISDYTEPVVVKYKVNFAELTK